MLDISQIVLIGDTSSDGGRVLPTNAPLVRYFGTPLAVQGDIHVCTMVYPGTTVLHPPSPLIATQPSITINGLPVLIKPTTCPACGAVIN